MFIRVAWWIREKTSGREGLSLQKKEKRKKRGLEPAEIKRNVLGSDRTSKTSRIGVGWADETGWPGTIRGDSIKELGWPDSVNWPNPIFVSARLEMGRTQPKTQTYTLVDMGWALLKLGWTWPKLKIGYSIPRLQTTWIERQISLSWMKDNEHL